MTQASDAGGDGRSLGEWVRLVISRWPILVVSLLIGIAIGLITSLTSPSLYEARATLVLSPSTGVLNPDNATDLPVLAATVARLADDEAVFASVQKLYAERVGPAAGARDLDWFQEHVEARVPSGTSLVQIVARTETRQRAGALADVSADALIAGIGLLGPKDQPGLNVARFGTTADLGKVSPRPVQNIVLWANAALLLGVIVALTARGGTWADWVKRRLGQPVAIDDEVGADHPTPNELSLPAYGRDDVIELNRTTAERFATLAETEPHELLQLWNGAVEPGLEGLRHRVLHAAAEGRHVVGVVGSAGAVVLRGIATELAGRLALGGASCVVVDANFHPDPGDRDAEDDAATLMRRRRGLGDVLDRTASLEGCLVEIPVTGRSNGSSADNHVPFAILPAGNPPIDPLEALSSNGFRDVIAALETLFAHVIIVAPPARWQKESVVVAGRTHANVIVLSNHLSLEAAARPLVALGLVKPVR